MMSRLDNVARLTSIAKIGLPRIEVLCKRTRIGQLVDSYIGNRTAIGLYESKT